MERKDVISLLAIGLAIWIVGTVYYAATGATVLETTAARFWSAFILSPISSAALCIAILRRRCVPSEHWAPAMLLLAIPGMIGEAMVLCNFPTFMPKLHAASAGGYGAFLFVTYAFVLSVAVAVTLGAMPRLAREEK